MRKTAFTTSMTGAFAALVLGIKWLSDLNSAMGKLAMKLSNSGLAKSTGSQLANYEIATYLLIGCGIVGMIISIMILIKKGNPYIYGPMLMVAGVLPLLFASKAMFGLPMVLGGLIAITLKKKMNKIKAAVTA